MDSKTLQRCIGLITLALLLAGQLTNNLPIAAEAIPVAPVVQAPDSGQPPVLPSEKSPVENVRAEVGLAHAAPPAHREAWAVAVDKVGASWGSASSVQQAHVRLQI